jgi:acyl dehydratase
MMMIELMMKVASLGGAGVDEMRWRVPVRPGDNLRARATILADSRISTTKPDRGVLFVRGELENQAQELVWEAKLSAVVLLKTPVEL